MANRWENNGNNDRLYFGGAPKSLHMVTVAMKLRCLLLGRKAMTSLDSILKSRHYFANKGPSSQSYGFSGSHVWMWELDYKESWVPKNWCFWTVVLEKTLESPLDCKEIQPVHPKGDQSWIFIGRTDDKAEPPILWPPDVKNWLIGKDPDAGKLKAEGEGVGRGWDGWMVSPTQWTWVWASSRRWWRTGKPGMLQSMESQGRTRLGHRTTTTSLVGQLLPLARPPPSLSTQDSGSRVSQHLTPLLIVSSFSFCFSAILQPIEGSSYRFTGCPDKP